MFHHWSSNNTEFGTSGGKKKAMLCFITTVYNPVYGGHLRTSHTLAFRLHSVSFRLGCSLAHLCFELLKANVSMSACMSTATGCFWCYHLGCSLTTSQRELIKHQHKSQITWLMRIQSLVADVILSRTEKRWMSGNLGGETKKWKCDFSPGIYKLYFSPSNSF